jgi:hypothetical protein
LNNANIIRSSFNPNSQRMSFANRQANQQNNTMNNSTSFHHTLNNNHTNMAASFGDNNHSNSNTGSSNISKSSLGSKTNTHKNSIYFQEARPFPYDRSSQTRLNTIARQLGNSSANNPHVPIIKTSHTNLNLLSGGSGGYNRANSTHKLYQDLNDYNKTREFNKSRDFKGHLV